ncbi:MAG: hypothetical protein ACKO7Y_00670 [Candidatus Nitrosotenuis sp.]
MDVIVLYNVKKDAQKFLVNSEGNLDYAFNITDRLCLANMKSQLTILEIR